MKKLLSLILTLALCFGLSSPAFAADTLTGNQLHPAGGWGNGPSLTLTGVVAEHPTEMDFPVCYDVEVGGSLVLEMPYPSSTNRQYTVMVAGTYVSPDFRDYLDNGQSWDVPKESEGGFFDAGSGKTRYVYRFTEADMGQLNGYNKVIYPMITWDESKNPNADHADDYGHVYFGIRVVPPKSVAYASTQSVLVDGTPVEFQMYALKDAKGNSTNYIKLRDLAFALGQMQEGFDVEWKNGAVNINTAKTYTANGSEMTTPFSGDRPYETATAPTTVDGRPVDLNAFILKDDKGGAYTYYQLRDLGKVLGFNVDWSREKGVFVETDKPYSGTN